LETGVEKEMINQTISHYKIIEKLGEGGMGVVYKAQDTTLDRIVALKFLPLHLSANEAEKARFLQEAKAAAVLNHPHVCTIYGISEHNGQQFIEMEYVDGETLRRKIPLGKNEDAFRYAVQIGEALQEAHSKGIVHRDVKCENIMVNSKNQIKVMDFGLAKLKGSMKLTKTSSTVGTLAYMAPEQIQGGEVDARSDIFSFGIVLFEMLTGKTPFRGEHDAAMMYSIVNEEPETIAKYKPDISPEVERIIRRALEKDPDDRYQSAADMISEIRRIQKQSTKVSRTMSHAIPAEVQSGPQPVSPNDQTEVHKSPSSKKMYLGIGFAAIVLLGGLLGYNVLFKATKPIDSLAVIPFVNAGGDPQLEYLSDGISESIINSLTRIRELRVIPRSTVFRFKGKDIDPQEIGNKLKVDGVLSGTVTKNGDNLDIQVDLIDVQKQSQIWGNHFTRKIADVLSLQEDIVGNVSKQLQISISGETQRDVNKRSTQNGAAYQLYLQGRFYWNKRTSAALERAIDYFNQAIALDSTFALAYAGLADCYIIQSQYSGIPTSITIPLTKKAAGRALELDNSLAEAQTTLAFCLFEEWDYVESERDFKQALALNPKYPTAYHWYNIMLVRTGRVDEAWKIIQQGHELDPFSPVITLNVGAICLQRKQYDDALRYFKQSIELDPSFAPGYAWAGLTCDLMNNQTEARSQLEKAVELSGRSNETISYLGYFFGKRGMRDEALKLLKENEERYRTGKGAAYNIARIYAGLGDKENVLKWLQQDISDHSTWSNSLVTDFVWDNVRTEPRFIALLRKMGLEK
jgi:eukaryotic-like serine/threonine-protein kinase